MKTKEISITGMLIALSIVVRYACSNLPNVQPLTAMFILIALFISVRMSAIVGAGTMFLTGLFLGFGIWVPLQMAAYVIIALVSKAIIKTGYIGAICWSVVASYLYGFITGLSMLPYIPNETYFAVWLSGISFDTVHAVSTAIFISILYPLFKTISPKVSEWLE